MRQATLLAAIAFALIVGLPASRASVAYQASLVRVVNPTGDSAIEHLTAVGPLLFFTANDGVHGNELWRSDGTESGTFLVLDINAGSAGSYPQDLANVAGTLLFTADDGVHGRELWRSDGTDGGTSLVMDIRPGVRSSGGWQTLAMAAAGAYFFTANDGVSGPELWRSDGTADGTALLVDLSSGSGPAPDLPSALAAVDGILFFRGMTDTATSLWRSDGTGPGTWAVVEVWPHWVAKAGDTIFYGGSDWELYKTNGVSDGPLVKDIWPGPTMSMAGNGVDLGGKLLFVADDGTHGFEPWRSDGTTPGTVMVKDVHPGHSGSSDGYLGLTVAGSTAFFVADDGTHGAELWKSNGTAAGTTLVTDVDPGPDAGVTTSMGVLGGTLFFQATDGTHGWELWRTDGTAANTTLVADINPSGDSYPGGFTNVNGTLFFTADDGTHGFELWKAVAFESPTIAGFSPARAPVGATVHVTGTNFTGASAVTVNGVSASFAVTSATTLTFIVPSGATSGPVAVTTPGGTITSGGVFTVIAQPTIATFAPPQGSVRTTVTVTGTGFADATRVELHGVAAPFSAASDTRLTFTVPLGATSGAIRVVNPAGSTTSLGTFTVLGAPAITGFSPASGPVGTPVTITGTDLEGVVGVMLGSVVTVPTSVEDTEVTFTIPPGALSGPIKVLGTGGSATSAAAFVVTP